MKATLLSWAAKRGVAVNDRLHLGYHADGAGIAQVYSRDNAARSLHILDAMLAEVRSGYFMPDCGRGGRFSTGYAAFNAFPQSGRLDTGENAAELPREEDRRDEPAGGEMPNEGEGHDTHIGEYATSASSSESEAEERRDSAGVNILPPSAPDGYRMLQHRRTKTIHYILADSTKVMACGRMVAEAHREPDVAGLRHDAAVCRCKNAVV